MQVFQLKDKFPEDIIWNQIKIPPLVRLGDSAERYFYQKYPDRIYVHDYLVIPLFLNKYPNIFSESNLFIPNTRKNESIEEIESIDLGCPLWIVSLRFKNYIDTNKIPWLRFFPCLIKGEIRYLLHFWDIPTINDFELDQNQTKITEVGFMDWDSVCFRSDILEYYGYQIFANYSHTYKFITGNLKQKFESENFPWRYAEMPVVEKSLDRESLKVELQELEKKSEELYRESAVHDTPIFVHYINQLTPEEIIWFFK